MAAAEKLVISPLIDPAYYAAHGYPHELWTRLRREDPVHRVEQNPEMPFWAITKHADIATIGKQPDKFLNGTTLLIRTEPQPEDGRPGATIAHMPQPAPEKPVATETAAAPSEPTASVGGSS